MVVLSGCSIPSNSEAVDSIIDLKIDYTNEDELWQNVFKKYLQDLLWLARDIYDAGHNLMVPIHSAFKR